MYAALAAALTLGAWRVHHVIDQGGYDRAEAEYQAMAMDTFLATHAKEQELITKNQKVYNDYQTEKKRRAADAVVSSGKLRDLQSALSSPGGTDTTAIGGADATYRTIIDQCAGALTTLDGHDKYVEAKAIALQSYAREVCVTK